MFPELMLSDQQWLLRRHPMGDRLEFGFEGPHE